MQSAMEPWLAERMGRPRELYLRLKNGFDFVLGRSDAGISIGRFHASSMARATSTNGACGTISRATEAAAAPLIAAVVAIRKAVEARGKPFVFVISPSKAAVLPEYLPSWCGPADRPRIYDLMLAGLKSANVPVVDGHQIALHAKETEEMAAVWPRQRSLE